MPRTESLSFTNTVNSSIKISQGAWLFVCLAALQEQVAINRKTKKPCEHPCTKVSAPEYEFSQLSECVIEKIPSRQSLVMASGTENWLRFQRLVKEWHEQRGARSSITETVMMPAYQEIIGMGESAVPLLLAQLRSEGEEPDQWFWALRAITGENPVKPEDQGDFKKMSQAWLLWAERVVYA